MGLWARLMGVAAVLGCSVARADPPVGFDGPAENVGRYMANWQLPRADGLYERWDADRAWASAHVISTLQVVAERMALELPLADPLMIGDISRKGGGHMMGHSTHNLGIDVDIGLFMDDGRQPLGGFVDVPPQHVDVSSTWILIRSLIDTGQLQFILLDQSLIDVLRDYVLHEVGLDRDLVDSIFPPPTRRLNWATRNVVRHAPNHRNHLHVRLVPPSVEELTEPGYRRASAGPTLSPSQIEWY